MATLDRRHYPHYGELLDAIGRARDWWRTIHILERVLLFVAGLFAVVFAFTMVEAWLHLSAAVRWPMFGALVAYLVLGAIFLIFKPLMRDWSDEEVAVHIERKYPELDNELINAVQLGVDKRVMSPGMVEALIAQTAGHLAEYPVRKAVDTQRARRLAILATLSVVALAVWAVTSFARFSNALQRLILPGSDIAAIGRVRIVEVKPGDTSVLKGSDLEVEVVTDGGPTEAVDASFLYKYHDGEKTLRKAMGPVRKNHYICRIEAVKTPLDYRVNVGGTESKPFRVGVIEPPVIVKRGVGYKFPSFTRAAKWEDRFDADTNGDVRAPIGTVVTLKLEANKPIQGGTLRRSSGQQLTLKVTSEDRKALEARFSVEQDGVYTIHLEDVDGIANRDPRENKIIALPDRAPLIEFSAPAKDVTASPGETVKIVINARDDYGFTDVALFARRGKEGPQKLVKRWTEFSTPQRVMLPFDWNLGAEQYGYKVDDEIFYYAVARDNHAQVAGTFDKMREVPKPQETKSGEFKIRIEDKKLLAERKADEIANWETELRKVLEQQIAARQHVAALGKEEGIDVLRKTGRELFTAQSDIFARTAQIGKGIEATDEQTKSVKESIELLAYGEMANCAKLAKGITRVAQLDQLKERYGDVAKSQDKIISALRKLLNVLPDLAEDARNELDEEDAEDFPDENEEKMKDLLKNLKDFVRQQKKAVETTDELAKLPMEDFTPEDEKKLEGVKAIEEKWSQFLKAQISDLSKMQEQDFANTTMLHELIEIHSEVEMAKDALQKKTTEIATALEDNGLMLAEKLTKQLEKWLPDTPDRDRWQMEEPLTDGYETPMAELPKELEDLVGDLMEEEEDLEADIEDATSAWSDSMDAAGWDAMDGPISNFAANGVTGNRLPNTSELSGRSAEGRQGKSTGEFVEDQFDGKGGRRTPTRLTPEAYQKGQIKDTSSTPPGGATGGGKAGGASGEGLEGPVPPDIDMKMKNFALRQAQLRNKAETIALKFEVLNYPPVFEPVIKDMKALEAELNSGRYMEARRRHGVLLKNLKGTRMFVEGEISLDKVRSPVLPAHLQDEIIDTAGAAVPDEFKDYIKSYYEAISKAR